MNLLLSLPSADPETEQAQTAAPAVPSRSTQEIADAMIRSMLGAPGQGSNIYTDAAANPALSGKPVAAAKKQDPAAPQTDAAAVPIPAGMIAVLPQTPAPAPNSRQGSQQPVGSQQNSTGAKLPAGTSVLAPAAQAPASKADLAFALKLTPVNAPDAAPSPAPMAPAPTAPVISEPAPLQVQDTPARPDSKADSKDNELPQAPAAPVAEVKTRAAGDRNDETPMVTAAAAVADVASHTNGFAQAFVPPAAAQAPHSPAPAASPVANAAQAMRTSEPATVQAAPAAHNGAAQEIAVRIARPDSPSVDVHLVQRAGQIQVSVRTPDTGLQTSLRQDLGTLVNSLERSGYRAEAMAAPAGAQPLSGASAQSGAQNHRDQSEPGNGGQNSQDQTPQQQQQRSRDQRSQAWIEELEKQG